MRRDAVDSFETRAELIGLEGLARDSALVDREVFKVPQPLQLNLVEGVGLHLKRHQGFKHLHTQHVADPIIAQIEALKADVGGLVGPLDMPNLIV